MSETENTFDRRELPPLCEKIFCDGGYASILPNFEYRPEQAQMAYCCAQAYAGNSALLFEAGTGVGKSMAYLVSGIIAARRLKRQLVVATHTIALQQQILEKDLPRIRTATPSPTVPTSRLRFSSGARTTFARTGSSGHSRKSGNSSIPPNPRNSSESRDGR